jgi:hypothetical protein
MSPTEGETPTGAPEAGGPSVVTVVGRIRFAPETRGDPLGSFPTLCLGGRPYNLWLTEQVLDPILHRWSLDRLPRGSPAAALADDIEWASGRCRLAFQEILLPAAGLGDPAILAAMGVTANLQRTLGFLGEIILDGRVPGFGPGVESGGSIRLSRLWCGFTEYPENLPYFPSRVRPPVHPARLHPKRRDPRHLANALWCSIGDINARCDEALAVLRSKILQSGLFGPEDLRHLHADSIPFRSGLEKGQAALPESGF